jgi:hypothetical protein
LIKGSVYKRCQCRDTHGRRVPDCAQPHGSWGFCFDIGRDHRSGRRRQVTRSGFITQEAAERALSDELTRVIAGVWVDDRNLTVGSWLQTWLAVQEQAGRSPKTLANYRGHVRDVWDPCLGHVLLRDLRRLHIEQVLVDLSRPGHPDDPVAGPSALVRSPVSPGSSGWGNVGRRVSRRTSETVDGYRRTLRAALSVAQRRGLIAVNPALGRMDVLPTVSSVGPNLLAWEPAQLALFLEQVNSSGDRLAPLYEVAATPGCAEVSCAGCGGQTWTPTRVA